MKFKSDIIASFLFISLIISGCTLNPSTANSVIRLKVIDTEISPIGAAAQIAVILEEYPEFAVYDVQLMKDQTEIWIFSSTKDKEGLISFLGSLIKGETLEGRIGDKVIFNSTNGIDYVCRSPLCSSFNKSGSDDETGCQKADSLWVCPFYFLISVSDETANRQAEATKSLSSIPEKPEYLNESFNIYVDGKGIESFLVGSELKGEIVKEITISGFQNGSNYEDALKNSHDKLIELQNSFTSLPIRLRLINN